MLIACESCHRQYQVGDLEPGARVRCFCGRVTSVPEPRARQVPMQHCSNCGGTLESGSKRCPYCEAEVQLSDRGWGDTCPECLARMVKAAKFCGACGTRIEPKAALRPLADHGCPRCEGSLSLCEAEGESFAECTACGGLWLSVESFETKLEETQRLAVADVVRAPKTGLPPLPREENVKYLPCPVCRELMNRRNFATTSGIIIDWCRNHGYWFDLHELEHVRQFVEQGGLERAREKRRMLERDRERRRTPAPEVPMGGLGDPFARRPKTLVDAVTETIRWMFFG